MPTYKTYRVGYNYVTIDADVELPPLVWDEVFDVTVEEALAIEDGAMPGDVVPEIAIALENLENP
jgi:hypothetical protein